MPGAHRLRGKRKAPWPYYIPTHWGQAQLAGIGGLVAVPEWIYGPSNGSPWVRDNAVPLAVTQPLGTVVTVSPGQLTQALLNANPGATFWVLKGTHSVSSLLAPLANQKFYLESAAIGRSSANTAVIDGGGGSLNALFMSSAGGVEIHGGLWQNQGNASSATWASAILATGGATASPWIVEDVEVANCYNQGIKFQCPFEVRRCYVHDVGFYGIACATPGFGARFTNCIMEHCHLRACSNRIHGTGSDAGQKFTHVDSSTFRYNWVEYQEGAGLWWDYQHKDHHIHDNVIEYCWDWGLFYEYSFGGSEIHNNYLGYNAEHYGTDSWYSAVQLVVGSTDATLGSPSFDEVRVHHNLLEGTSKQMGVLENFGRPHPKNCKFYENKIVWSGTDSTMEIAGAESNDTTDVYNPANGNTFQTNAYYVDNAALARWQWQGTGVAGASKTFAQWQAHGHDIGMSVTEF